MNVRSDSNSDPETDPRTTLNTLNAYLPSIALALLGLSSAKANFPN